MEDLIFAVKSQIKSKSVELKSANPITKFNAGTVFGQLSFIEFEVYWMRILNFLRKLEVFTRIEWIYVIVVNIINLYSKIGK